MRKEKRFMDKIRLVRRLLGLVRTMDDTFIPLALLESALSIFRSFFSLYMSAALIDALLEKSFRPALFLAGALLFVNLLAGAAGQIVQKQMYLARKRCVLRPEAMMREKLLALDYETAQRTEILHKLSYLQGTMGIHGGPERLVMEGCRIGKSLAVMVISASMVLSLCLQRPPRADSLWDRLASPALSLLLFAVAFAGLMAALMATIRYFSCRQEEIILGHSQQENALRYLIKTVVDDRNSKIIRMFSMEEMLKQNIGREHGKLHDFFACMLQTEVRWSLCASVVTNAFLVLSCLLVVMKVLTKAVTIGAFTRYSGALGQFASAFEELAQSNLDLRVQLVYMEEFLEFLDMEETCGTGTLPVEKRLDGEYELCFEDVSFCYPGGAKVLDHVSCRLNMKGKMAVVGRNGAGKTTFIKLLCRLYEPTEGRITLNGIDIRKYDAEEYRSLFGVVFQDFKLFAFPVGENLAAGQGSLSDWRKETVLAGRKRDSVPERQRSPYEEERMWTALTQAGAAEAVRRMPKGLDTFLYHDREDGVDLSGGEAQKLALARALYKDAPVVILDEPTAALDPISEAQVYAGFDQMVENKTSIYISHRMSSCRFCGDILVFDQGTIVERGSHERLLARQGVYAGLWEAQARYYQEYAAKADREAAL